MTCILIIANVIFRHTLKSYSVNVMDAIGLSRNLIKKFKIRVICDGGRVCLENVMHVWRAVNEDNGRQKSLWENTVERTLVSCCSTPCIICQQSVIVGVSLSVSFKD